VQLNGDLSADPAHGETSPPVAGSKNPCRRDLYRAKFKEEKKRREKQENIEK